VDLAGLVVERVIVHGIPRKLPMGAPAEEQEELNLSEALAPLPDTLRLYVTTRLVGSLQAADKAFDVVFNPSAANSTPQAIRDYLAGETNNRPLRRRDISLVDLSRLFAEKLFEVQPPQPPGGLLAICSGKLANLKPFLGIMKLEHERGVTVEETDVDGKHTFRMTVEDSLVLVAGTKVFKAAAFSPVSSTEQSTFPCHARLSDNQNPFTSGSVASYFARRFLGVELSEEPRVTTEKVFKAVEKYTNTIADPARQVAATRALFVEMSANKDNFSAVSFGNQHLRPEERRELRSALVEAGLPTTAFPKDLELIKSRLRLIALELEGHITVVAPEDRFRDDTISVDSGETGNDAVVTIKAGLKQARSRGR
jgi:hypothetical protein